MSGIQTTVCISHVRKINTNAATIPMMVANLCSGDNLIKISDYSNHFTLK